MLNFKLLFTACTNSYFHFEGNFINSSHVHTYIMCHYNPSVNIIDLVSHTTCVVCVNFTQKRRDLQLKVERQIFWETFHGNFIYSQSFSRNLLRGNRWNNTFCILFWCLVWGSNPGFTSNKPSHYLLNNCDFSLASINCH